MIITLADAISVNGHITEGERNVSWFSAEDQEHFSRLRAAHDVIVLGRATYEQVRPAPEVGKLRVVLTHTPERFAGLTVPDQLEFMSASPAELVELLTARGRQRALIAGGSVIARDFLQAGLVNELYLTFEPIVIGSGKPMVADGAFTSPLRLQNVQQLNARGTLLAHYVIEK